MIQSAGIKTVRAMVDDQFPTYSHLDLLPVTASGTDNWLFRLGKKLCVRLPKSKRTIAGIERECRIMPQLEGLPLETPELVEIGAPTSHWPSPWLICTWLEGNNPVLEDWCPDNKDADAIATFLIGLRARAIQDGLGAGPRNHFRGVDLYQRDSLTRQAMAKISDVFPLTIMENVWQHALSARSTGQVAHNLHGDLHPDNLLLRSGKVTGILDWGLAGTGDAACDLMAGFTLFGDTARTAFRDAVGASKTEWARGKGWALSTAAIAYAHYRGRGVAIEDISARTLKAVTRNRD